MGNIWSRIRFFGNENGRESLSLSESSLERKAEEGDEGRHDFSQPTTTDSASEDDQSSDNNSDGSDVPESHVGPQPDVNVFSGCNITMHTQPTIHIHAKESNGPVDLVLELCQNMKDIYVKTHMYAKLTEHISEENCIGVTIIGSAGDGKTAASRAMGLELYEMFGYQPVEVKTVNEIHQRYSREHKTVFLVDDPLGAHCVYAGAKEEWVLRAGELERYAGDKNIKVIVTIRTQIWEACKYELMRFQPFKTVIDMSCCLLSEYERRCILTKYMRINRVTFRPGDVDTIVLKGVKLGFPQCCKLGTTHSEFQQNPVKFFLKPLKFIRQELQIMSRTNSHLFGVLALVSLNSYQGKLLSADLKPSSSELRLEHGVIMKRVLLACGVSDNLTNPTPQQVRRIADAFNGTYLVKTPSWYGFSHDSMEASVILEVGKLNPELILTYCSPEFISQFVQIKSALVCAQPENSDICFIDDSFADKFAEILNSEILKGHLKVVFDNPSWRVENFQIAWKSHSNTRANIKRFLDVKGHWWQRSVLHWITWKGLLPLLEFLVEDFEESEEILGIVDRDGDTILHSAAFGGDVDTVKFMLERKFQTDVRDDLERTPLYVAAARGHLEVIKILVEYGADVNSRTKFGSTPLLVAAFRNFFQVVLFLCDNGAEATVDESTWKFTDESSIEGFVSSRAGGRDIHLAVRNGNLDRVKELLNLGCDVDGVNNLEWTALYIASIQGHVQIASLLLENGAEPDRQTSYGFTPLYAASTCGNDNVESLLLSYGAQPI